MKVRQIPSAPDRYATKDGKIWRIKNGKYIEVVPHLAHGYPTISITKDGKRKKVGVRSLICDAYNLPKSKFYIHKDMDVKNNAVQNLVVVDAKTYWAYIAMVSNGGEKLGVQKGERFCRGAKGELKRTIESQCEFIRLYFVTKDETYIKRSFVFHLAQNTHPQKMEFAGEIYDYFYRRCVEGYGLENPFLYIFASLKYCIIRRKIENKRLQYQDNIISLWKK